MNKFSALTHTDLVNISKHYFGDNWKAQVFKGTGVSSRVLSYWTTQATSEPIHLPEEIADKLLHMFAIIRVKEIRLWMKRFDIKDAKPFFRVVSTLPWSVDLEAEIMYRVRDEMLVEDNIQLMLGF